MEEEGASVGDARGKHRILAELGRVEQEVKFLEVKRFFYYPNPHLEKELWYVCRLYCFIIPKNQFLSIRDGSLCSKSEHDPCLISSFIYSPTLWNRHCTCAFILRLHTCDHSHMISAFFFLIFSLI